MIPISTDAPIYHYPIATVGLIVLNTILFIAFCREPETSFEREKIRYTTDDGREIKPDELANELRQLATDQDRARLVASKHYDLDEDRTWRQFLSVEFGSILPWQWLTNNYMHAGWGHLIGNMIFLWSFGLIVEGKVGALAFLGLYNAIGIIYGLVLQLLAYGVGAEGYALGASAAIFGLLALCVAWAPVNEFEVVWFFGFRGGLMDITIINFCAFYVGKELLFLYLGGFHFSSELLHVLGFIVALPIGLWCVRSGLVDCEGWDIFSYLAGRTGLDSKVGVEQRKKRDKKADEKETARNRELKWESDPKELAVKLQSQVEQAINEREFSLAAKLQYKLSTSNRHATWRQQDLYRVIDGLLKAKQFDEVLPLMEKYVELFDVNRFQVQLMMIKVWLQQQYPRKALQYMASLNLSLFQPDEVERLKALAKVAKKQIADGVIELT